MLLTEITWPAARGRTPKNPVGWIETTARGQRARLGATYKALVRERRKLGISQADWFSWATQYDNRAKITVISFRYSGLVKIRNSLYTPMPILRTYSRLAARYEGCRKGANAGACS